MDILYGAEGHEPSGEDVSKLATEIYQNNLLLGPCFSDKNEHSLCYIDED